MNRVVVVGGGIAGCAAAVAAASAGAAVTMLVADAHLGGVAATGEHRTLCGLAAIDAPAPDLLEPELVGAWIPHLATGPAHRLGRVWLWPTDAATMQRGLARRLADVEVLLRTPLTSVHQAGGRIVAIHTLDRQLPCAAVIDASGAGTVARLVGAAMQPGLQWPAYRVVVAGPLRDDRAGRLAAQRAIRAAWPTGHALAESASALTALGDGRWQLSLDVPPGTAASQAAAWAAIAAEALGCEMLAVARAVARRDDGRPVGTIDLDRLFAERERGLCWAAWPQEDHRADGVHWRWPDRDRHGVPADVARLPGGPDNLWLAGRGLAVTPEAAAALRVTGTALAMGTAVGLGVASLARTAC
jgi:hypothetical protein